MYFDQVREFLKLNLFNLILTMAATDPGKVVVSIATGNPANRVEYNADPSPTFVKSLTGKPRVSAPPLDRATLGQMRHYFNQSADVKLYLRLFMQNLTSRLDEDWTSLSINIGRQFEDITPNNLIEYVDDTNATTHALEGTIDDDKLDLPLIAAIIFPYRVKNYNLPIHNTYKTNLAAKLTMPFQGYISSTSYKIDAFLDRAKLYTSDPSFRRMVGTLDMFLNKFPTLDESILRKVTLVSRSKESTALSDFVRTLRMLSMDTVRFAQWMWCKELYDEYNKLSEPGCEIDDPNGYAHYLTEFGLVGRNPTEPEHAYVFEYYRMHSQ